MKSVEANAGRAEAVAGGQGGALAVARGLAISCGPWCIRDPASNLHLYTSSPELSRSPGTASLHIGHDIWTHVYTYITKRHNE